jgi:uncharacterized membrane protein
MLWGGALTATRDDLRRWAEAGLIDAVTAERIAVYESRRASAQRTDSGRPSAPELVIYLAAAITAAGIAVLVATNWDNLGSLPRIAIPTVSSVAAFAVGYRLRQLPNQAMVRAASLLWLLAGALAVAAVGITAAEVGWSENNVALAGGIAAILISVALWVPMRMHPQIVGMGGAAFLFSIALSSRFAEDWIVGVLGASLAAFGSIALVAVERRILVPRLSGQFLAAAGLAAGGFFAGMPPTPLGMDLVAVFAVVVLLGAGIRLQSLVYIAFGVLTAFAALLTLVLRYIDDPTLAGLALVAVGLLLMLAIAGITRTHLWSHWRSGLSELDARLRRSA